MLRENNTLEHLGLAQFRIQNTGADWIANAMKSNTALRTLDLSGYTTLLCLFRFPCTLWWKLPENERPFLFPSPSPTPPSQQPHHYGWA